MFENRVLRRIFIPKKEEITGENYMMRSFIIYEDGCLLSCSTM
jgi:hypothetical protein